MSRKSRNIKVGFSNQHENDLSFDSMNQREDLEVRRESYIEFGGITRVRSGTAILDEDEQSEKIINDIVAMDASFDYHSLPDLGLGKLAKKKTNVVKTEKYANFHTIDWLRDLAKDRFRNKWVLKERKRGMFEKFQAFYDHCSGWFCVLLVGIGAGIVAGVVDIGSGWSFNLKSGFCNPAFWLNREQCCWTSKNATYDDYKNVKCEQWTPWTSVFGFSEDSNGAGKYFVGFLVHVIISLIFALMAATLVKFYAPYACGSGVPEIKTILSGFVIRGYLGKWTLVIKSLGMIFGTSAGLTLGKEGPFVHVASCCGNIFSYLFPKFGRNEAKKREILSAAASAGVAVAFGAPIGGVLFSLEEVSYYFPLKTLWRSFFCAMAAAFVVKAISPFGKGHDVLFFIEYKAEWFLFELIPFIVIGMLGGLFGLYFIKLNIKWCRIRKTTILGKYPITEVLLITLITATVGYFNEYTRMSMSDLVRRLVNKCGPADDSILCDYERNVTSALQPSIVPTAAKAGVYESIWKLILALAFYLVMLIFTFGIKVPCGLFVPSLTIGAISGRLIGIFMELIWFRHPNIFSAECERGEECIVPGIYALVGACAFLGGATRMTVSLVVIMIELTSGLSLIVPLMVAAFTAKLFGEWLCPGGIYDAHINLNNYPFLDNKEEYTYGALALDVMKPQPKEPPLVVLVQDEMTVKKIEEILSQTDFSGYPIVVSSDSQRLFGYITRRDLKTAFDEYRKAGMIDDDTVVQFTKPNPNTRRINTIKLFKLVELAPICVLDQTPMDIVIDLFRKIGVSIVLVTHYGRLLGTITKKDILKHLNEEKERERLEAQQ